MNNPQEKTVLSAKQKSLLKQSAHHLKPVVLIGSQGFTSAVTLEIDNSLLAHELIKIQIVPKLKEQLDDALEKLSKDTNSIHVATVGHIIILFRQKDKNSKFNL